MRPDNVFKLEIAALLADGRALIIRFAFTLLLGLPFVVIAMPAGIQVAGLQIILLFTGFFGATVHFARRRAEGHFNRLKLLPLPVPGIIGDMLLAGVLTDCAQMGLLLVLFIWVNTAGAPLSALLEISGLFVLTVSTLNLLGTLLAFLIQNTSEAHLFGALATGLLAFFSGLFPVPESMQGAIEGLGAWNPLSCMGDRLLGLTTGREAGGGFTPAWIVILGLFTAVACLRFLHRDGRAGS